MAAMSLCLTYLGMGQGQHNPNQLGDFGSEGLTQRTAHDREHFARFDNTLPNVLFGHSMGSAIALRYAQLHPHLEQLILSGVPYRNAHLYQLAYHTAVIEKRIKGPNSTSLLCSQTAKFNDCFAPVRTAF
jgi:pimeloyl-ACP methyl ester carboxylesterase